MGRREEENYPITVQAGNPIRNPGEMICRILKVEIRDAAGVGEGDLLTEVAEGESFQIWVDYEASFPGASFFNPWTLCITAASSNGEISEYHRRRVNSDYEVKRLSIPEQPQGIVMPGRALILNIYGWGHPDLVLSLPDRTKWYTGG